MDWRAIALILPIILATPVDLAGQIYRLAEMNTEQIRALDRARTVIIMPGGVLEEHGPYLPSYADGYYNQSLTADLAAAIAKRPGWSVVLFPEIPLGAHGANGIGYKHVFPGTYTVRPATLRAVYMDLASALGDQGFRWIFVVNLHGGPSHSFALDQAGDYFRDTYGGRMVHLGGIVTEFAIKLDSIASPAAAAEDGFTVHGSLNEHSTIMALRPDLVPATVRNAPSITGKDFPDLVRLARMPDWPGYFGAPRYASAAIGRAILGVENPARVAVALRILDGADERTMPRFAPARVRIPGVAAVWDSWKKHDAQIEARQSEWLARNRIP